MIIDTQSEKLDLGISPPK